MKAQEQALAIVDALGGHAAGDGWKVRCPAHDDRNPSLSLTIGRQGDLVWKCHAGCGQLDVMEALRARGLLNGSDLGGESRKRTPMARPADSWLPTIPAPGDAHPPAFIHHALGKADYVWNYSNEKGRTCFYVCRWDRPTGKQILPCTFGTLNGKPGWHWKGPAPGTLRPLFNLGKLIKNPQAPAIVVEGEKSCDAAAALFSKGVVVTSSGGAKNAKQTDWTGLKGRRVLIWPDNDQEGAAYADDVARLAAAAGAEHVRIAHLTGEHAKGWDAADFIAEGGTAESLEKTIKPVDWTPTAQEQKAALPKPTAIDAGAVIEEMNTRHAFVWLGSKAAILVEPEAPGGDPFFTTKQELSQAYANRLIPKTVKDKESGTEKTTWTPVIDHWWKSPKRRQYDRVTFLPGREAPAHEYNLWRGFSVKPEPGDCSLYLRLIEETTGMSNPEIPRYILDWMAHAMQKPMEKPGTALALPGGQGAGKGTIAKQFGKLFGPHFLHAESPDVLTGRFNLHLANKIILFADESFFSGDHRVAGILKARITETDLTFEGKGKDPITLPNYWRIIAASNERWMVPAAMDDRRWAVFKVGDQFKGDRSFWQVLHTQMENGGRAALLYHLLERDLSAFVPAHYPHTEARGEQIVASMEPLTQWWFERLSEGTPIDKAESWPDYVTCADVLEDATAFVQRHPRKVAVNKMNLSLTLRNLCGLYSVQRWKDGSNKRIYELPTLDECRARLEAATTFQTNWPPATDETVDSAGWATKERTRLA